MRNLEAAHLHAVLGTAEHQIDGDDLVPQAPAVVVDVFQKKVERREALLEAPFDVFPLGSGQDPGYTVDGNDLLRGPFGVEDREGDALVKEVTVNALLKPGQILGSEFRQGRVEALARLSRTPVGSEHLIVVARIQVVICEYASFRCTTLRHTASGLRGLVVEPTGIEPATS